MKPDPSPTYRTFWNFKALPMMFSRFHLYLQVCFNNTVQKLSEHFNADINGSQPSHLSHFRKNTLDIYPKQFDRCDKRSGLASQVTLMVENWSREHRILAKWITRFCTSQMAVISYLLHKAIQLRQKTPLNNVLLYQQVTSVATKWRNSKKSLSMRVKHPLKCCEDIHQRKNSVAKQHEIKFM